MGANLGDKIGDKIKKYFANSGEIDIEVECYIVFEYKIKDEIIQKLKFDTGGNLISDTGIYKEKNGKEKQ